MNTAENDDDKNPVPPGSPEIAPVKDPQVEEEKAPVKDPQPPHKKESRLGQR